MILITDKSKSVKQSSQFTRYYAGILVNNESFLTTIVSLSEKLKWQLRQKTKEYFKREEFKKELHKKSKKSSAEGR